ncbi:MAG TPA: Coq4 family protein [Allocoleopsis sp.]
MNIVNSEQHQWEAQALTDFIDFVKAPNGDFGCIARLSKSLRDTDSVQLMVEFLSRNLQGKQALQERPLLGSIDLQQLHQLPENTLGYAFADWMFSNGLTPLQPKEIPHDEDSFVAWHITETHDLWHIVTGCTTDITGEIELEAFYVAQLSASRFWLALLAKNLLKAALQDIEVSGEYMDALTQGWMRGKQAKPLFGLRWNELWEVPLEQLRQQLNLERSQSEVLELAHG